MSLCARGAVEYPTLSIPLAHYTVYLLQAPKGCLYVPGVLLNTLHYQYPWHIIQSICHRPLKGVFMCQGCCWIPYIISTPWHIIQSICYRPLNGVFMCQGCCWIPYIVSTPWHTIQSVCQRPLKVDIMCQVVLFITLHMLEMCWVCFPIAPCHLRICGLTNHNRCYTKWPERRSNHWQ